MDWICDSDVVAESASIREIYTSDGLWNLQEGELNTCRGVLMLLTLYINWAQFWIFKTEHYQSLKNNLVAVLFLTMVSVHVLGRTICLSNLTKQLQCIYPKDKMESQSFSRVFAVRMKKAWVLSYPFCAQRRLWSDWADAQADLSLRCAHRSFCLFCVKRLIFGVY